MFDVIESRKQKGTALFAGESGAPGSHKSSSGFSAEKAHFLLRNI